MFSLKMTLGVPKSWQREWVSGLFSPEDDDVKIYTELRLIQHKRLVAIGS